MECEVPLAAEEVSSDRFLVLALVTIVDFVVAYLPETGKQPVGCCLMVDTSDPTGYLHSGCYVVWLVYCPSTGSTAAVMTDPY